MSPRRGKTVIRFAACTGDQPAMEGAFKALHDTLVGLYPHNRLGPIQVNFYDNDEAQRLLDAMRSPDFQAPPELREQVQKLGTLCVAFVEVDPFALGLPT